MIKLSKRETKVSSVQRDFSICRNQIENKASESEIILLLFANRFLAPSSLVGDTCFEYSAWDAERIPHDIMYETIRCHGLVWIFFRYFINLSLLTEFISIFLKRLQPIWRINSMASLYYATAASTVTTTTHIHAMYANTVASAGHDFLCTFRFHCVIKTTNTFLAADGQVPNNCVICYTFFSPFYFARFSSSQCRSKFDTPPCTSTFSPNNSIDLLCAHDIVIRLYFCVDAWDFCFFFVSFSGVFVAKND